MHAGSALCVSPACVDTSRGPGQHLLTVQKHLLSLAEVPKACMLHFKDVSAKQIGRELSPLVSHLVAGAGGRSQRLH